VVAIVLASGLTACSGTLIAPHLVLTAGHCTIPGIIQGASVAFGSSLADGVTSIPIARAVPHPQFDLATLTDDVGVLVLASTAPVAPVVLGTSAPDVGATVGLVGWGLTGQDAGDTGVKRQGTAMVTAVDTTTFDVGSVPSQPCDGDSGGPALTMGSGVESVVGVTSHGDAACVQGGTYTRVDAFLGSFIEPTMAAFAEGSAVTGAQCLFPEQCAGGASACVVASDDANLSYCTTACQHDADCPAAMTCAGTQCRYPGPTPGAYGSSCASDADCDEGECTTTGVCALRCDPDAPTCPAGFACSNTADIDFFCIATPPPVASKSGGCVLAPVGRSIAFPWVAGGALALLVVRASRGGPRALRRAAYMHTSLSARAHVPSVQCAKVSQVDVASSGEQGCPSAMTLGHVNVSQPPTRQRVRSSQG